MTIDRSMASLPDGYRAVVIGASGGIGAAMVERLEADARCAVVHALHRRSAIAIDFDDESSIGIAADALRADGPVHLLVNAAGVLHANGFMPEKRLADLRYAQLTETFRVNTFGPALVVRHFAPLLSDGRSIVAMLSARVGSIEDNRLGGWYAYRASKAALNMIVRTAAIEIGRAKPAAVIVAMHPGTVATALSRPFRGDAIGRPAEAAAADMLAVLDALQPADSGRFVAYDGRRLPW